MKQILLNLLLSITVLFASLQASADNYFQFEVNGIYYHALSDNTCEVVKKDYPFSYSGSVDIPSQVAYDNQVYTVIKIGQGAFYGCRSLTSVNIPNSVTTIGPFAFLYCSSLLSVSIPDSVIGIGDEAFSGCSLLSSIIIPESVTAINRYLFANCTSLESVSIGKSVTKIEQYAFAGCSSLTSVTIPDSVKELEEYTFFDCKALTSVAIGSSVEKIGELCILLCPSLVEILVAEDNNNFCSVDGVLFNKDCSKLVCFPNANCYDYIIPDTVTEIVRGAFDSCSSLRSVVIPDSVTIIGALAFFGYGGSSLTTITIPNSVKEIGGFAFSQCDKLSEFYYDCLDPVEIEDDTIFKNSLEYATLFVPFEAVEKCKAISPWKYFNKIEAYDFSGVESVAIGLEKVETECYDMNGHPVPKDYKGIVIVRYSDGLVRKMICN